MFSLVIPTNNCKAVIKPLLNKVTEVLRDQNYEVLVIDDDSHDKTALEVLNLGVVNKKIKLVVRRGKSGFSSAVLDGFRKARGDVIGVMPATLLADTGLLNTMIGKVREGSDLVVGSGTNGLFNRLSNKVASFLAKKWLGVQITNPSSDFFVLKKSVFKKVGDDINPEGFKILLEICARAGQLKLNEVFFKGFSGQASFKKSLMQLVSLRPSFDEVKDKANP